MRWWCGHAGIAASSTRPGGSAPHYPGRLGRRGVAGRRVRRGWWGSAGRRARGGWRGPAWRRVRRGWWGPAWRRVRGGRWGVAGCGTRRGRPTGGPVPVAAARAAFGGASVRPAAEAMATRAPRRRPCRRTGSHRVRRGGRCGAVRRSGRRHRRREHRPPGRPAYHVRAGVADGRHRPAGARRRPHRIVGARASRLPGHRVPALGTPAGSCLPRSAGAARSGPGAAAAAAPRRQRNCSAVGSRPRRGRSAGGARPRRGRCPGGARPVSGGRGARAAGRRAARTPRPGCTPARTGAADIVRRIR
ncbi:MAG: hypothetical protein QOI74_345 [Micromonosporaceae bacterium]|nr:hypothetical protein [Micromonosporaceae bacterium]